MDDMDFNKCVENIQVHTSYFMATVFQVLDCKSGNKKNSLASRGDGHMKKKCNKKWY